MSETSLGANFDKQSPAYMAELSLVTQLRSVATEAEGDTRILSVPGAQVCVFVSLLDSMQFLE